MGHRLAYAPPERVERCKVVQWCTKPAPPPPPYRGVERVERCRVGGADRVVQPRHKNKLPRLRSVWPGSCAGGDFRDQYARTREAPHSRSGNSRYGEWCARDGNSHDGPSISECRVGPRQRARKTFPRLRTARARLIPHQPWRDTCTTNRTA